MKMAKNKEVCKCRNIDGFEFQGNHHDLSQVQDVSIKGKLGPKQSRLVSFKHCSEANLLLTHQVTVLQQQLIR